MTIKIAAAVAALALCLVAQRAAAGPMLASDLAKFCNAPDKTSQTACGLYVLGVENGMYMGAGFDKKKPPFCLPDDFSMARMAALVTASMKSDLVAHPEDGKLTAGGMVAGALVAHYPCK